MFNNNNFFSNSFLMLSGIRIGKDELINVKNLASFLSVSEKTIRDWVFKGTIPFVKFNGSVRFVRREIENWLQKERS